MRRHTPAAALWIAGALVYLAAEGVSASAFPGYSYTADYISDLGVPTAQAGADGSPLSAVMNTGFVLQGLLYLAAAIFAVRATGRGPRRTFLALAAVYAVGNLLVALVHGSQNRAEHPFAVLHVVGAAMAIIGGNVASIVAGLAARRHRKSYTLACVLLGVLGLLGLVMLQVDSGTKSFDLLPDGTWERLAVYPVTVWQILTGLLLLNLREPGRRRSGRGSRRGRPGRGRPGPGSRRAAGRSPSPGSP